MSQLIYQQIASAMADISAIGKTNENRAQGFNFRGIDDVYNEIHSKLVKYKIFTVPEVLEERREERPTKNGGVMTYVILKVMFTLFASDGSKVTGIVIGEASDSGDKASNKAMSVAHKYFFIQIFCIPTNEPKDPDADSTEFAPRNRVIPAPVAPPNVSRPSAPVSRPALAAPKAEAPKPVGSAVSRWKPYGDFIIKMANKEWEGRTVRDVVDDIGLPHFLKSVAWWANESKRAHFREIQDLDLVAKAFAEELANNHASETLVNLAFNPDEQFEDAPKVGAK